MSKENWSYTESKEPSARLNYVAEEIKDLLKEHDITGVVALAEPGISEFLLHLTATWSKCYLHEDPQGTMIRIRSKLSEYAGDRRKQGQELSDTVNILVNLRDVTAANFDMLDRLIKMLERHMDIDTSQKGTFTPHKKR